jgi:arylsulfatase A-like enzyme
MLPSAREKCSRERPSRRADKMSAMNRLLAGLAASALVSGCGRAPLAPPRNVLLVSVDTLRRDHLELFGYSRTTAPHVAALAAGGVTFDDAITPLPKTGPSLATLMTGLHPETHRVELNLANRLDEKFPTLAEVLRARGFRTGAVVSNTVLLREQPKPLGLDRGFETYDDLLDVPEGRRRREILERRATANTDAALAWLRAHGEPGAPPFFLWVHYIDPHGLYDPPEPWRSAFRSASRREIPIFELSDAPCCRIEFINWMNLLDDLPQNDPHHDLNLHVDRYDGEIAYADSEIGRLLAALDAAGRAADTLVVFVSDHGESFGEHGVYFEHGFDVFDENVRIPLVMRAPTALPRGRRVAGEVEIGDVFPTVLDLLGVPGPRVEGRSLAAVARGDERIEDAREIPVETNEGALSLGTFPRGLRTSRWKCVLTYRRAETGEYELEDRDFFDLASDPGETTNRFDPNDARCRELERRISHDVFPSAASVATQTIGYAGGKSLVAAAKALEEWRGAGGAGGAAAVARIGEGVLPSLGEWIARETDPALLALESEAFRAMPSERAADFLVEALRKAAANARDANEAAIARALAAMPAAHVVASLSRAAAADPDARLRDAAARTLAELKKSQ